MKQFAVIGLSVALLFCSVAMADEILFRNIPWGTSATALSNLIKMEEVEIYEDMPLEHARMLEYEHSFDYTDRNTGFKVCGYTYTESKRIKVAGYPVYMITGYCAYGRDGDTVLYDKNDSRMYAAQYVFNIVDYAAAYSDLQNKLTSLYGKCVETEDSISVLEDGGWRDVPIYISTWSGDNGTQVALACSSDENRGNVWSNWLNLVYKNTLFDEELDKISDLVYRDETIAEKDRIENTTDGL